MAKMYRLSPEDMMKPDVIKAVQEGRVIIIVKEDNEAMVKFVVKRLMNYVVNLCEEQISLKTDKGYIHAFLTMLTSENLDDFEKSLMSKDKRVKFLCQIAGVLLEVGLLKGSARDIASRLRYDGSDLENRRRYINEGRRITSYTDTFQRFCNAIPNYPTDLCIVKTKRQEF